MVRKKQVIWGSIAFILAGTAIATGFNLSCSSCGNSNSDRLANTRQFLHNATALQALVGQVRTGDTFTIIGGDNTSGKYKLYSATASIRFGCVSNCTAADWESELFIMPAEGNLGGGGGGGDPSGGGSYGGGGGYIGGGGCYGACGDYWGEVGEIQPI